MRFGVPEVFGASGRGSSCRARWVTGLTALSFFPLSVDYRPESVAPRRDPTGAQRPRTLQVWTLELYSG